MRIGALAATLALALAPALAHARPPQPPDKPSATTRDDGPFDEDDDDDDDLDTLFDTPPAEQPRPAQPDESPLWSRVEAATTEAEDAKSGANTAIDRKSTRLNSSHIQKSRMPSSA